MNVLGQRTNQTFEGDFIISKVNYNSSNESKDGEVLHIDANKQVYWDVDDLSPANAILYNGVPPTTVNQLLKCNSTDGKQAKQSTITEDGTNLNLNSLNITKLNNLNVKSTGKIQLLNFNEDNQLDILRVGDTLEINLFDPLGPTILPFISFNPIGTSFFNTSNLQLGGNLLLSFGNANFENNNLLNVNEGTIDKLKYPLNATDGITIKNIVDGGENYVLFESYVGPVLDGIFAVANNFVVSAKDFFCAQQTTTKNLRIGTLLATQYTFPQNVGTNGQILKLNGSALEFKDNILPAVVRGSWYVKDRVPTTFFPLAAINTWYYLESSAGFNELHVLGLTQAIVPVNKHRITNTSGATILAKVDANFSLIIQSGPSQEVEFGIGIDAGTPIIYMGGRVDDTITAYPTEMSMSAIVSIPNNSYLRFAMRTLNNASQVNIYYASFTITTIL